MAKYNDAVDESGYSSTVRKALTGYYDTASGAFIPTSDTNPLPTTATISGDVNVDSTSVSTSGIMGKASGTNADFTTAYASATTITCSSLPSGVSAIKADDIVSIVQVATDGSVTNTYSRDDVTITASGTDPTTLTVTGAAFVATDTFVVYTNIPQARGDKVDLIEVAGTATNVNGGNRDAGTQTVTLADDDPAVTDLAAIEVLNTTIAGDTTSLDAKTPALGTAAMAASRPVTIASDDTLTTAANASLAIMDDWDATEDSAIGSDGAVIMHEAKSAQKTAVADADAVIPVANLYGEAVIAGHTWGTNSNRSEEIDPVDEHYVEEELIDTTNVSAATNYYPSSTGSAMGNFNNLSIHFVTSGGVTMTVEAKIDDSTDWVDITPAGYELSTNTVGNASFIDTSGIISFDNLHVRNVRIKSVTSDATNAVQYHWKKVAL